jgi:hypothetical protein
MAEALQLCYSYKMIKLRPHHLLCILSYVGKGYSQSFTDNFDALMERINKGEREVEIVTGPDDICAPRLCDASDITCHCYEERIILRDKIALENLNYSYGDVISLDLEWIKDMRVRFHLGENRQACQGCQWYDLCTGIAEHGFKEGRLK